LDHGTAEKIFSGDKSIEGRFTKLKIAPFNQVGAGDLVYIKESGMKKIIGQFRVDRVIYFDHPRKSEIDEIKRKYLKELSVDKDFWWDRENINYISLIFIDRVQKFVVPPIIKHSDRRGWVVLP